MAISSTVPAGLDPALATASVSCPKCGASIPITEALSHQARESASRELALARQRQEAAFAERERKIASTLQDLESQKAKFNEELASRLQAEKTQMQAALRKEIEAQKGHEFTALQELLARRNHQIEEAAEKQSLLMRQKADLEDKERNFKLQMQEQLDAARAKIESELADRLQKEKAVAEARLRQEFEAQKGGELAALQQQLAAREKQATEAQARELQLLKQKADLEDEKRNLDLQVQRQLSEERSKVADKARAEALEESRLRMLEKDKQAEDLRKQIETLQQKALQGSVQTQGEVLELDFEARLRAQFPADEISPVATGQRGADVRQIVRTAPGNVCGSILWEAKRTRNWSPLWIAKLKADQRGEQAELAIIVTQALPKEVTTFGCVDGIWVTDFASALPLATALRQGLLSMAAVRQSETGKHGKMEELYGFLTSTEFRQKIEAIVEAYSSMQADLEAERKAMDRIWAKREKQLRLALSSTAQLYGGVQGILGAAALPDVPALALPAPQ